MKKEQMLMLGFVGIMLVFRGYTIVIGQPKPVLVVLNKDDATLASVDPVGMRLTAKVTTGNSLCRQLRGTDAGQFDLGHRHSDCKRIAPV